MTPADLIARTITRLRTKGWRRASYGNDQGPNCLSGALIFELDAPGTVPSGIVHQEVRGLIHSHINDEEIVIWNDAPGRTADEVITLLETIHKELTVNG